MRSVLLGASLASCVLLGLYTSELRQERDALRARNAIVSPREDYPPAPRAPTGIVIGSGSGAEPSWTRVSINTDGPLGPENRSR